MNAEPLASILIITCDVEQFVAEAIESALAQDYPAIEVVVSDDASRDSTPEIIRRYADRYPNRVKALLHTGSRSPVRNDNRGLAACSGEFVAVLDGDDLMLSGKISTQVAALVGHPDAVICRHPVLSVDEQGSRLGEVHILPELRVGSALDILTQGFFIESSSNMMRRSAIPAAGVPEVAPHAPDFLLAIEVARKGSILRVDEVLSCYRKHPGQITAPEPGSEVVFEDTMRAVSYVEDRYPELAHACPGARADVARWEAHRRRESQDLAWVSQGLRQALRLSPLDPGLWRAYIQNSARRLRRHRT
jgi:hypothetical protein